MLYSEPKMTRSYPKHMNVTAYCVQTAINADAPRIDTGQP